MAVVGAVGIPRGSPRRPAGLGLQPPGAERRQHGRNREGEARALDGALEKQSSIRQRAHLHGHLLCSLTPGETAAYSPLRDRDQPPDALPKPFPPPPEPPL